MAETIPFTIAVPDARIAEIHRRVRAFPWSDVPEIVERDDPWAAGASLPFLRDICDYWVNGFDWRAQEAAINRLPQLMAVIDGQRIHVLHERGSGPARRGAGADAWMAGVDRRVPGGD